MHNVKKELSVATRHIFLDGDCAKHIICNTVCAVFYPLFDILAQFRPKEYQPYSVKCLVFFHVATARVSMIIAEKLATQRNRYTMGMIYQ